MDWEIDGSRFFYLGAKLLPWYLTSIVLRADSSSRLGLKKYILLLFSSDWSKAVKAKPPWLQIYSCREKKKYTLSEPSSLDFEWYSHAHTVRTHAHTHTGGRTFFPHAASISTIAITQQEWNRGYRERFIYLFFSIQCIDALGWHRLKKVFNLRLHCYEKS